MADKFISRRNLNFLLDEVFDIESLTRYPYYEDHNAETFKMVLDTALKMATNIMYPVLKEMDENHPQWVEGQVKVHPVVKDFMRVCGEGGWINAEKPYEVGGQQLPVTYKLISTGIFSAANYSLGAYPMLTGGAANLIFHFASEEIKDKYMGKMYSGEWQGTMALTEPDVGSSLGDLTTMAEATDSGYYLIKGKKIFISAGDHDAVDNVVHLMLGRIKGAPAGVKGISLFVVPKYRINPQGALEYNDVECGGIEHKLGYRGCPIAQLTMGENKDCHGYLVGEANQGLKYMFMMMNEERINVGLGAISKATAAYYASLEYAQQRLQGRRLAEKDPNSPMVPLIEHPDIKRMLLFQRAITEGSMALTVQLSLYEDLVIVDQDKEKHELLLDLLVPIVKTYPSEMGILSTSAAIQILGGYGYCGDFPVEQYYRDIRIDTLHEGTTGIQGQDILGRKVTMHKGKAFALFLAEVKATIDAAASDQALAEFSQQLQAGVQVLQEVTANQMEWAGKGKMEEFLADSVLYLELISIIAISWQWLKQAQVAAQALAGNPSPADINFYQGKLYTARYFFGYELPKIHSLAIRLKSQDKMTVAMPNSYFEE